MGVFSNAVNLNPRRSAWAGSVSDTLFPETMFNLHHLELFYFVAKYGGISAAARNMPYGIGQPAISGQMTDFERLLGRRLFERKPFKLTAQGRELYEFIALFFDGLPSMWHRLKIGPACTVRIAVDETLGLKLLPAVLAETSGRMMDVGLELVSGPPASPEVWLRERQAHLAISASDRRIPGIQSLLLARVAPCLLVAEKAPMDSPGHFWQQARVSEPLIAMEASVAYQALAQGLRALGVEWQIAIRVDSAGVMRELVADGRGVGIDVELPVVAPYPGVRAIPLLGFERVPLAMHWLTPSKPLVAPFVDAVQETAGHWWPAKCPP